MAGCNSNIMADCPASVPVVTHYQKTLRQLACDVVGMSSGVSECFVSRQLGLSQDEAKQLLGRLLVDGAIERINSVHGCDLYVKADPSLHSLGVVSAAPIKNEVAS